jgi:predicted transcriptional regulator
MTMDAKKLDELREYYDNNEVPMDTATGRWEPADETASADRMSGFSFRLPADVLERVRGLAQARGIATGEWIREAVEAAVVTAESSASRSVNIAELLAFIAEHGRVA